MTYIKSMTRVFPIGGQHVTLYGRELIELTSSMTADEYNYDCTTCGEEVGSTIMQGSAWKTKGKPTKVYCKECVIVYTELELLQLLQLQWDMQMFIVQYFSKGVCVPGLEKFGSPDEVMAALEAHPEAFGSICRQATTAHRANLEEKNAIEDMFRTLQEKCGIQVDDS